MHVYPHVYFYVIRGSVHVCVRWCVVVRRGSSKPTPLRPFLLHFYVSASI